MQLSDNFKRIIISLVSLSLLALVIFAIQPFMNKGNEKVKQTQESERENVIQISEESITWIDGKEITGTAAINYIKTNFEVFDSIMIKDGFGTYTISEIKDVTLPTSAHYINKSDIFKVTLSDNNKTCLFEYTGRAIGY